jgi:hypothetical protein
MKTSWTDRVTNGLVLHTVKVKKDTLHTIKRRKANWIGYILRGNCLLKQLLKEKEERKKERTEVT